MSSARGFVAVGIKHKSKSTCSEGQVSRFNKKMLQQPLPPPHSLLLKILKGEGESDGTIVTGKNSPKMMAGMKTWRSQKWHMAESIERKRFSYGFQLWL